MIVSISTVARTEPCGIPSSLLRVAEHVVPEPRLEVGLHLRQVEVRAAAARELLGGVVEEVQAEVDEPADERPAVQRQVRLVEVPAARPGQDHRQVVGVLQLVALALRRREGDGAPDGVGQVDLALDDVAPVGRVGVLEVGEPDAGAGVERVDRHLAAGRAGDLDPAVPQVARGRRDLPVGAADLGGGVQERRPLAGRDPLPAGTSRGEQLVAPTAELPLQVGHERQRLGGQHLLRAVDGRSGHLDARHRRSVASPPLVRAEPARSAARARP